MALQLTTTVLQSADGSYNPDYPAGDKPVTSWQLPMASRVGQKLPLSLIAPQSDASTPAFAAHRKASTNHDYTTRVAVQGGEMPFRMTFIQSPIGATISGEFDIAEDSIVSGTYVHTRPEDYGVVTWPNASGTGTFEVLIEDQSGATTTALWTRDR